MNQPRSETIRQILEARRPMAEKARKSEENLHKIESQIRSFREGLPSFAGRLDTQAAAAVMGLKPEADQLLSTVALEKGKLALLAGRFSRTTLNIGVAGRARQGKSTLLQQFTGLTSDEIPSGDKGHCTGAPSIVANSDVSEAYAEITFHTETSFLNTVIAPFFHDLRLGERPFSLSEFENRILPEDSSFQEATKKSLIAKLRKFKDALPHYRNLLTGSKQRVKRHEIREYIAQVDQGGTVPFFKWMAVEIATIYCRFPHDDVGSVAFADTPGLGDFLSGAEDRLVEGVGRNLDAVLFLKRPPADGTIITPEDTGLYDLIAKAIPDLPIAGWSYFVVNRSADNEKNIPHFMDILGRSNMNTRLAIPANCANLTAASTALDTILADIAGNLSALDQKLFSRQQQALQALGQSIAAFAEKAATELPKSSVVAPDDTLLNRLFGDVWNNLGFELQELVKEYREKRDDQDEDFLSALKSVFDDLNTGPSLPDQATISRESAPGTLMKWHANKLTEVRVKFANSFEHIDTCLNSSFSDLRIRILNAFVSEKGGALKGLQCPEGSDLWQVILKRLEGLDGGEEMQKAIRQLLSSGLSFRGFIQPRVRKCLDVLDSDSPAAADFEYSAGDSVYNVMEKIGMAWENACFNCKSMIEEMAKEPAMARFAVAEDFREAILHTGGENRSREIWHQFYKQSRPEIWPNEFKQLEAETLMRKEWEAMIQALRTTSAVTGA